MVRFSQIGTFRIVKLTSINKRFIYDASPFGLKEYDNFRLNAVRKATPGLFETIKTRLENSIRDKDKEVDLQDLNMFLLLSKNSEDLDLLLESFKKYKNSILLDKDEKFGEKFVKLCYLLNNSDKMTEAFNDDEIKDSLMSQLTSFLIINKLIIDKKYDEAVKIFEHYLETVNNQPKNKIQYLQKTKLKKQTQIIPFGHLRLVFEALMLKNTKDSFLKMKELISKVEPLKCKLNNTAIACCFLLSLKQNEPRYAYELALSIEKFNVTLQNNLKAIALGKLNKPDEAFFFIETILNLKKLESRNDFEGKFFPDTLESLRDSISKMDPKDSIKKDKFDLILKEVERRLFRNDLFGYCTNVNVITDKKK
ncbi:unnamed protein product [Brachionus calyciflorus]|uniref:Uncharacterized protein n=1 Tax=Brachionus calyciflorus TaxID=104777 RepID=A0A814HQU4_9BILA|nr:unnamed protein product [Brachionus calyciflorus]